MLVYAGLWTQCDKNGVFFYKAREIKNNILPYIDFDMQKTLDILKSDGYFIPFKSGNREYGYIPNFGKYQFPTRNEKNSPSKYPELPKDILEHTETISDYSLEDTGDDTENIEDISETFPRTTENVPENHTENVSIASEYVPRNHTEAEGLQDNRILGLQEFTCEPPSEPTEPQSFPTADAVAPVETALVPVKSKPPGRKKQELTPDQLGLFHAAKACFETSEKAKSLMYQDKETTSREMSHLKTLVIRCSNMAPGITADFLRNVLEHYRVMTNGRLKGKAVFTPRALITPWIWELVIDSLPEDDTPELRESIRGLFA